MVQHALLAFYWIIFCGLHSIMATPKVKDWFSKEFPLLGKHYRLFYTVFAAFSLGAVVFFQWRMSSPLLFRSFLPVQIISGLLLLCGSTIMALCIRKYFLTLSGVKSLYAEGAAGNELRIDGIHRFVRHPLYLGTFLAIWGAAGLAPYLSFFISNMIITGYTIYAIKWEEEKLVAEFGEAYTAYKRAVPKLLPHIRKITA